MYSLLLVLFFFSAPALIFADSGGLSARFLPEKAYPGDLVELSVEMDRADYGQFDLELPRHPRLHLVSREKIPPSIKNGRYLQGERIILQALSSGPLTFSGIQAELTEANGSRSVSLPDLVLNVIPFATADPTELPEPLPNARAKNNRRGFGITHFLLLAIIALLLLIITRKPPQQPDPEPLQVPRSVSEEEFETILEEKGDALSAQLRKDLETWLYAPESAKKTESAKLKNRLLEELN